MYSLPEKFLYRMQQRLGEKYPAFLASYERAPYRALRINTLKLPREEFERIAPPAFCLGEEIGSCGLYTEAEKLGAHPYHFAGLFYLQEPSAMEVGELAGDVKGLRVLDLCAAPGGKTTHIAQKMGGEGILIANEIDFKRAKILSENVERMGITNCAVLSAPPETLAEIFPAYFDLVLVDAPCSGEGMFKKEPNAVPEWSEENVAMCAARQKKILAFAAKMLRAGGRLIYSTCTFSEEEDEWQIHDFLEDHLDFSQLMQRKFYPHEFKGEGHFMAMLELATPLPPSTGGGMKEEFPKEGAQGSPLGGKASAVNSCAPPASGKVTTTCPPPASGKVTTCPPPASGGGVGEGVRLKPFRIQKNGAAEKAFSAFCADFFGGFVPDGGVHTLADGRMYLVPAGMPDLTGAHLLRLGVELGEWDGKNFKPAHALALAYGDRARRKIDLTEEDAKRYLRGETLTYDAKNGWCVLCLDGYPLGLGKAVDGMVKNHYSKRLRLRS